jgi:hypothetical protein
VSAVFIAEPLDAHDPDYSMEAVNEFIVVILRAHKKKATQ